jgi:hypothetical protein
MCFLRRNRFLLAFPVLLGLCGFMVKRQIAVNLSKHIKVRDEFIMHYMKGYKPEAERLYTTMLRDLEDLPTDTLKDDLDRTAVLVDPTALQPENLIWRFHWTVKKEWEKRVESTLMRK